MSFYYIEAALFRWKGKKLMIERTIMCFGTVIDPSEVSKRIKTVKLLKHPILCLTSYAMGIVNCMPFYAIEFQQMF